MVEFSNYDELIAYLMDVIYYGIGHEGPLGFQGSVCETFGSNPKGSVIIYSSCGVTLSIKREWDGTYLYAFRDITIIPDEALCVKLPLYIYDELKTALKERYDNEIPFEWL